MKVKDVKKLKRYIKSRIQNTESYTERPYVPESCIGSLKDFVLELKEIHKSIKEIIERYQCDIVIVGYEEADSLLHNRLSEICDTVSNQCIAYRNSSQDLRGAKLVRFSELYNIKGAILFTLM
jgi:hypothetical protein